MAAVRDATAADLPALVALVQSAYRGDSARVGWTHEADLLDGQRIDETMLRDLLANDANRIIVLEDGPEMVGCVAIEPRDGYAYIGMVTVAPDRQGAGVGARLLTAAEWAVIDRGFTECRMTVIAQREKLIGWYERKGYRRTGDREPFPYGDERFGRPRRDDLAFVVLSKTLPSAK